MFPPGEVGNLGIPRSSAWFNHQLSKMAGQRNLQLSKAAGPHDLTQDQEQFLQQKHQPYVVRPAQKDKATIPRAATTAVTPTRTSPAFPPVANY